jgi:inward rectifier potassium channel
MQTELNRAMPQPAAKDTPASKGSFARTRKIRMGSTEVQTHGLPRAYLQDVYHYAMTLSWRWFMAICALAFLMLNTVFASLYMVFDDSIANQFPAGFLGAFFFSVETLATVGYGDMHPATLYAHWVATGEIFLGMASVALITGVMFARFSRPKARILFSEHPVVVRMDGRQTLMIRMANARQNMIVDASAKLRLIQTEETPEGTQFRRIYDLKLRRDEQPMFILGWSLMHDMDAKSPLQDLRVPGTSSDAILVVSINGVDETTGQTMQSRFIYDHQNIRWGHRHVDLLRKDAEGNSHMDYTRIHETEPEAEA